MGHTHPGRPGRSFVLALALVCSFATPIGSRAAPPPERKPKTTFLPSVDLLPITNPSGRGTATGGSCHGLVEAALVYKAARDVAPGQRPPLADVRAELEAQFGSARATELLHGLAVAEQHHVYQQTVQLVQTDSGKRTIFENLKTSLDAGQPVRVGLSNDDYGERHLVVVYDYERDANGNFVFRVGDPNHPNDDTRTITYTRGDPSAPSTSVKRLGAFGSYGSNGRVMRVRAVQAPLERQPERLLQMIDEARTGTVPRSDSVPPPDLAPPDKEQASAIDDPEVGGVLLRFPSSWYDPTRVSDAEYTRLVGELTRFIASPRDGGVVVVPEAPPEAIVLVPVDELTRPGATTIGSLTRVRGWVEASGRLYLMGLVEPGEAAIPLELLSVALELVWKRGLAPSVSLDPDPGDVFGAQRARIGDVPEELHDTAFVRTMLAADYAMKELTLGTRTTRVEGFRSIADLIAAGVGGTDQDEVLFRLWLVPLVAPGVDVMETRTNEGYAVRFESHIQVLTENMVRMGGALVGAGARSEVALATAGDFTARFDALAAEVPVLARLGTVFELAKLAALARARGVDHPALAALAGRAATFAGGGRPPDDEPRPPWMGIGPLPVAGTDRVIGGGAHARFRARAQTFVANDRLVALIDAASADRRGPIEVPLPSVIDLSRAAADAARADESLREAVARMREGDVPRALGHLDRALAIDGALIDALVLRALLRRAAQVPGALEDAARAAAIDDRMVALHALIAAEVEVAPEVTPAARRALDAADRTAERYPEDALVQLMATLAHLGAADLEGARERLAALVRVAPFDEGTRHVEGLLALLLDGPMTRAEAVTRVRLMRAVPFAIQQRAKAGVDAIDHEPEAAVVHLEAALAAAEASTAAAVRELIVSERVRFMLIFARYRVVGTATDEEARGAALTALRDDVRTFAERLPDSVSANVAQMLLADAAKEDEARLVQHFEAATRATRDPVLSELGVIMQAERPEILLGLMTAWGLATSDRGGRALTSACAEALAGRAGDAPIVAVLRALLAERALDLPTFIERRADGRDIGRAELERSLDALRRIMLAVPSQATNEAIGWWLLPLIFKAYAPLEQEIGEPARVIEGATRFLQTSSAIVGRSPFAEQVLALRAGAVSLIAAAIGESATTVLRRDGERLEAHVRALEEAGPGSDAATVRRHLGALADGIEALVGASREAVAAALARIDEAVPRARPVIELQLSLQQRTLGGAGAPAALIASLREVPGIDVAPELARFIAATRAVGDGVFVTTPPERLVRAVAEAGAHDRVTAETSLRALALVDVPGTEEVVAELRARVRLGAFTRGDDAAESRQGSATPWLAWTLGAALLVAGVGLAVRRRLRRPPARASKLSAA